MTYNLTLFSVKQPGELVHYINDVHLTQDTVSTN